ncbi:hypothetical protein ACFLY7_00215 [Patescibacteria group bacterium]
MKSSLKIKKILILRGVGMYRFHDWSEAHASLKRIILKIANWRGWVRKIFFQPTADVVFISNTTTEEVLKKCLGKKYRPNFFEGPIFTYGKNIFRLLAISTITKEIVKPKGRAKAKIQMLLTIDYAIRKHRPKVILFAAGLKRILSKEEIEAIKKMYPNTIFTIGDNGTAWISLEQVRSVIKKLPKDIEIGIAGATGFIGEHITKNLKEDEFNLTAISKPKNIKDSGLDFSGIQTVNSLNKSGKLDVLILCGNYHLNSKIIEHLRKENKKLIILDVCIPQCIPMNTYNKISDRIIYANIGNVEVQGLKSVLGSAKILGFGDEEIFGCFAETIAFFLYISREKHIGKKFLDTYDFFSVNKKTLELISGCFDSFGLKPQKLKCFGKEVANFDTNLHK